MDEAARAGRPALDDGRRSPEQIREDIEQTREQLGATVEALAAKTDVKAQARSKVDDAGRRARDTVQAVRDKVAPAGNGSPAATPDPSAVRRQLEQAAADNPIAVRVLCAFAAGVLVGVLVKRR
ncbi:MAG: hypothetical protein QOI73_472 [Solirubrobacteraceae bacterium]|nr:hypothetical protein [Solirubrobacteraceae bacterium]